MSSNDKIHCKHKYVVGYEFRMPHAFFKNLPCDKCGCSIKLSLAWRILFCLTELIGFMLAFSVSTSVQFKVFGSTFLVSLLIFVLLLWIAQFASRLILKYGRWIEVK